MIEMLIKFAIMVVVLVLVFVVITWGLAQMGVVIPQIFITGFIVILVLVGLLWFWRNRGGLGL